MGFLPQCTVDENGGPCTECAYHNRECVIDELADKRRKIAARETEENLRKTQEELEIARQEIQFHRSYSDQIIKVIRYSGEEEVEKFISLIRRGASNDEIRAFVSKYAHVLPHFSLEAPHALDSIMDDGPMVDGPMPDGGPSLLPR